MLWRRGTCALEVCTLQLYDVYTGLILILWVGVHKGLMILLRGGVGAENEAGDSVMFD